MSITMKCFNLLMGSNLFNFFFWTQAIANNNGATFKYCMLQSQQPRVSECVGRTAISFLQQFDEQDNYTLASNFVVRKDDKQAGRSLVNMLDTDPVDFRGILENAGAVFSQRSMEWHMDALYPGLMFKVGPTSNVQSVAEFVLDPSVAERNFGLEEPSTARILAKQYLLPFLLGLKFNLVALVPLIFAVICLLLKKSLFFAKLAIYISSLLGVGGAVGALSGGFGGFGTLLNGIGGGFVTPFAQTHATTHAHAQSSSGGYYPAKISAYQHYDELDELQHHTPYKRNDRKLNYNKPRELLTREVVQATIPATTATDRFYDYEKQVQLQQQHIDLRDANGKLGQSVYNEEADEIDRRFKPSPQLGWKVVDVGN